MRISKAKKFTVADAMAPAFSNLVATDRNVAFGVIINATIKLNGKQTSLKQAFSEQDAIHVTNLILRRVYGSTTPEITL